LRKILATMKPLDLFKLVNLEQFQKVVCFQRSRAAEASVGGAHVATPLLRSRPHPHQCGDQWQRPPLAGGPPLLASAGADHPSLGLRGVQPEFRGARQRPPEPQRPHLTSPQPTPPEQRQLR